MAAYFWVGGTGTWDNTTNTNWATVTGGAGGFGPPTSADTATFDASSGTGTCTTASTATCDSPTLNTANILLVCGANFTITNRFTLTLGSFNLNNFTLSTQFFASNNSGVRSIAFGTGQITLTGGNTGGVLLDMQTATNFSYTGTSKLVSTYAGALLTRNFRFGSTAGASEANVMNLSITAGTDILSVVGSFLTLDYTGFSGTGTPAGNQAVYRDLILSTGMTIGAAAPSCGFYATSGIQKITTSGKTLDYPLIFGFNATSSATTFQLQDGLTQGATRTCTLSSGTLKLKASVTSTVGSFVATSGTMKYISSTTLNTRATLSQASGTVNASYLTVQDIAATGGATWNALWSSNNVDAGNNSGWTFGAAPLLNAGEYAYVLRSFTTPRRF